jgi:type II secretory pathway pseudopilin PulG
MSCCRQLKRLNCESGTARSRHASGSSASALTLLEMMVSITLLAIIMIGLLSMFQHTQKALHIAHTQTDVFENARGAIQLVTRDLVEMTAYEDTNVVHLYFYRRDNPVTYNPPSVDSPLVLPSGTNQYLFFDEGFWLTKVNDDWQGVGYYVSENPTRNNSGVGTLYRFSGSGRRNDMLAQRNEFEQSSPTNSHRVSDGIVHFYIEPFYVRSNVITREIEFVSRKDYAAVGEELPAFVDIEIGVLEPNTVKQFQALVTANPASAQNFLRQHEGRIHFFRERVPIRNFINPYRANEVP